jgi:hypothetical protein
MCRSSANLVAERRLRHQHFCIGIGHSPWHLLQKWLELLLVMVISKYLAGRQIG